MKNSRAWRNHERTRLPLIWLNLDSVLDLVSGLRLSTLPRGSYFLGYSGFPSQRKRKNNGIFLCFSLISSFLNGYNNCVQLIFLYLTFIFDIVVK